MEENEAQHLLRSLLESAVSRHQAGQHILLCGSPALCRKTLLAVIPQVEGITLRDPSVSVLARAGDMAALLSSLKSDSFLFIDNLHRLSKPPREVLAEAMERFTLHLKVGQGPQMKQLDLNFPHFTLIGGASRPPLLADDLQQRFKQQIWIDDPDDASSSTKSMIN